MFNPLILLSVYYWATQIPIFSTPATTAKAANVRGRALDERDNIEVQKQAWRERDISKILKDKEIFIKIGLDDMIIKQCSAVRKGNPGAKRRDGQGMASRTGAPAERGGK